jgi:hypothetical protein
VNFTRWSTYSRPDQFDWRPRPAAHRLTICPEPNTATLGSPRLRSGAMLPAGCGWCVQTEVAKTIGHGGRTPDQRRDAVHFSPKLSSHTQLSSGRTHHAERRVQAGGAVRGLWAAGQQRAAVAGGVGPVVLDHGHALEVVRALPPRRVRHLQRRRPLLLRSDEQKLRIVTLGISGGRSPHRAVTRRPPIPLDTVVPRTGCCAHYVGVWNLSIVQGPFSVAPCQTLALRFATFPSLYLRSWSASCWQSLGSWCCVYILIDSGRGCGVGSGTP